MADSQWLTWEQAAEFVGCPVATIEWHKRQGRIRSRGRRAASLERASVEEFAIWWRHREAERAARPRRVTGMGYRPPEPTGWISTAAAGDLLGITASEVVYRIRRGYLAGERSSGRWWLREAEVQARAEEERRWMTQVEVAELAGCAPGTVHNAVERGEIVRRPGPRRWASLERESAEAWAAARREEKVMREQARELARRRAPMEPGVWLKTSTAAIVLGVGREQVRRMVKEGRIVGVQVGRTWWARRDSVEQVAAQRARVAEFQRAAAPS